MNLISYLSFRLLKQHHSSIKTIHYRSGCNHLTTGQKVYLHQHYCISHKPISAIMDATTNRIDNGRFGQFDSRQDHEDNKDMFGGMSIAQYK